MPTLRAEMQARRPYRERDICCLTQGRVDIQAILERAGVRTIGQLADAPGEKLLVTEGLSREMARWLSDQLKALKDELYPAQWEGYIDHLPREEDLPEPEYAADRYPFR